MSIRNVVKVMNFHALIRVDNARRQADKYKMMEEQLMYMMDNITNNRNLILDKKIFEVPKKAPEINIYIGSDLGFCSNYNSQMNEKLSQLRISFKKTSDRTEACRTKSGECGSFHLHRGY
ncbi:MAG: hypothetical protein V8S93_12970 [Lachnospiraceae bacterium]